MSSCRVLRKNVFDCVILQKRIFLKTQQLTLHYVTYTEVNLCRCKQVLFTACSYNILDLMAHDFLIKNLEIFW